MDACSALRVTTLMRANRRPNMSAARDRDYRYLYRAIWRSNGSTFNALGALPHASHWSMQDHLAGRRHRSGTASVDAKSAQLPVTQWAKAAAALLIAVFAG